ncbi:unnamed protein product [marine sediment metagenome]|uniref:Uncharacterized protein n=1 Tax=marine sediment metagenome TaxID=412755 RepID=X1JCA5_9ZZZZ
MSVELPRMFPSFDDRIEEIQPYQKALMEIGEEFAAGNFPIFELMELTIPLMNVDEDRGFSDKQKKAQRWIKDNPRLIRRILVNPAIPPIVKVPAALTVAFVAYGTGGRGPGQLTPEIQAYDESAFGAPGVGGYSII